MKFADYQSKRDFQKLYQYAEPILTPHKIHPIDYFLWLDEDKTNINKPKDTVLSEISKFSKLGSWIDRGVQNVTDYFKNKNDPENFTYFAQKQADSMKQAVLPKINAVLDGLLQYAQVKFKHQNDPDFMGQEYKWVEDLINVLPEKINSEDTNIKVFLGKLTQQHVEWMKEKITEIKSCLNGEDCRYFEHYEAYITEICKFLNIEPNVVLDKKAEEIRLDMFKKHYDRNIQNLGVQGGLQQQPPQTPSQQVSPPQNNISNAINSLKGKNLQQIVQHLQSMR